MRTIVPRLALIAALGLGTGCSSGQSAAEPPVTQINPDVYKAQLAVGVATFSDGSKGLNTVATFRQPNGLSGTLLNTPTLTGPPAFKVPAVAAAGSDGGTNHISGSPQVAPLASPAPTTFGESGGVFAYGFAPENSDATGTAYFGLYAQAFYGSAAQIAADSGGNPIVFEGGPPAYPQVRNGNYAPGFLGYTQGFVTFAAAPVIGAYALSILIPAANAASTTVAATPGTMTSVAGLGPIPAAPTFLKDGAGGGTAGCTVPAGAFETLVDLVDIANDGSGDLSYTYYTVYKTGGGLVNAVFPDNLGAYANGAPTTTIPVGDQYSVSCIAANYPVFESGPPQNKQQLPKITGSNGQADVSFSPSFTSTY